MKRVRINTLLLCCAATLLGAGILGAQPKLPQKEIPILAWYGIPADEAKVERFQELKDAGFTLNFRGYSNADEVVKALDAAQKVGVKIIAACPELRNDTEATVKRFMKHPALAGYFLRDEPLSSDFPALGEWARKVQAVDDKHFCYLNLFPNGGKEHLDALGVQSYREYVSRFDREVPMQFLSFDHYPITYDGMKPEWYENLEEFSDESKKAGKDFWAFAMATKHWKYPHPTLATLRLQMFSDLAYGAQGLQYFTYWTPVNSEGFDYEFGPIGLDGKRTVAYDRVRAMNQELKALSGIFVGAKVISVRHTGDRIPRGTKRLTALPEPVKGYQFRPTTAAKSFDYAEVCEAKHREALELLFSEADRVSYSSLIGRLQSSYAAIGHSFGINKAKQLKVFLENKRMIVKEDKFYRYNPEFHY